MRLRLPAFALAAGLLLAGSPAFSQRHPAQPAPPPAAHAWAQTASDLPADPDVRYGTLPNGMRYALRHNATPPNQTSLRLRIDAGSLEEQDDQRGLAHFIEHMAFNGSTHVAEGEFVHRLERLGLRFGADTNAGTEFAQTVYKLDLPERPMPHASTRACSCSARWRARSASRRRRSIASAASSSPRSAPAPAPQYRIFVDQMNYLLRGQLLPNRLPIGIPEVIATAQRARFAAFYDAYYRPERATLIAVGDFNLDEMEAKIRARFGDWHGRGAAGAESRSRRGRAAADRDAPAGRARRAGAGRPDLGAPARSAPRHARPPRRAARRRARLPDPQPPPRADRGDAHAGALCRRPVRPLPARPTAPTSPSSARSSSRASGSRRSA